MLVVVEDCSLAVSAIVTVRVRKNSVDWKSAVTVLVACDRRLQGYLIWGREWDATGTFGFLGFLGCSISMLDFPRDEIVASRTDGRQRSG